MSVLVIGDLHYKKSNQMVTDIVERELLRVIIEENPLFVVILGDTFNDHNKLFLNCYIRVCKFFDKIQELGKHIFLLIGNHEREDNKVYLTDEHFFYGHKKHSNITVVDKSFIYTINEKQICFMPYVPPDKIADSFVDCGIDPKQVDLFFGHIDIHNSKTEKLAKAKWFEWPSTWKLMISGHVHDEEYVASNFIYVGTPYQQSYAESYSKYVNIFNLQDNTLRKIELNTPKKKKYTLHFTDLEVFVIEPNTEIKLDIMGSKSEAKRFLERPDLKIKFAGISKHFIGEKVSNIIVPTQTHACNFYTKLVTSIHTDPQKFEIFSSIFYDSAGQLNLN